LFSTAVSFFLGKNILLHQDPH